MVDMMKYVENIFKNYATFSGRARRAEFWYFYLFNVILIFATILVSIISQSAALMILLAIYFVVSIIPSIAVTVRRLHDTNKSGWWYFINFVPFIGPIWLFILMVQEGNVGDNQYGTDPKIIEIKPVSEVVSE
jgi:uncharacterized membrane protein YhaH (DUF805 family)